eukprot:7383224-Prymnesium_polylepis.1
MYTRQRAPGERTAKDRTAFSAFTLQLHGFTGSAQRTARSATARSGRLRLYLEFEMANATRRPKWISITASGHQVATPTGVCGVGCGASLSLMAHRALRVLVNGNGQWQCLLGRVRSSFRFAIELLTYRGLCDVK